jgi:RND family efflux transporter MFP subunit
MPPPPPPEVVPARAVEQEVTDYDVFFGKTQAEKEVDVRARVSGYLDKINFTEGAEVHAKDVLFEIDPRPFQAELERAEANVGQAEAHVQRLEYDYERAKRLLSMKSMSREDYDKVAGDLAEARASLKAAEAARSTAQLNRQWCHVAAPVGGRISRRFVDPGNMVKADETSLTRIESLDPIYAYFDVDERTYLRIRKFLEGQEAAGSLFQRVPVSLGLSDGDDFPYEGTVDFVDNRVDPDSGSVWVRGTFPNPKRQITPGVFARVRLPTGRPHRAVLIPEEALGTDQGQRFVYVLTDKNEADYRKLEVGAQHGPLREVKKGVKAGERVIRTGLQRVRPGAPVKVKEDDKPAGAAKAATD